jgi:hypothetical protein
MKASPPATFLEKLRDSPECHKIIKKLKDYPCVLCGATPAAGNLIAHPAGQKAFAMPLCKMCFDAVEAKNPVYSTAITSLAKLWAQIPNQICGGMILDSPEDFE